MADHDTHDHTGIPGVGGSGGAGTELDYVQKTTATSITATTEATANTVVTGAAVAYDGSTVVMVEFYAPYLAPDTTVAARTLLLWLYDGSSSIGSIGYFASPAANSFWVGGTFSRRLTPSAASHTYSIRASVSAGTGSVSAGAGGAGAFMPAFMRITQV